MIKNLLHSFLSKAIKNTKALALGAVLLTAAVQAQNHLTVRFYNYGGGGTVLLDVTVLDQVFGTVTVNGTVQTADYYGSTTIADLPASPGAFAGIQLVVVNSFGGSTLSLAQADALIEYVKQGGVLVGCMENAKVATTPNTDFNEYMGERLLLQSSVDIHSVTVPGSGMGLPGGIIGMYHREELSGCTIIMAAR